MNFCINSISEKPWQPHEMHGSMITFVYKSGSKIPTALKLVNDSTDVRRINPPYLRFIYTSSRRARRGRDGVELCSPRFVPSRRQAKPVVSADADQLLESELFTMFRAQDGRVWRDIKHAFVPRYSEKKATCDFSHN